MEGDSLKKILARWQAEEQGLQKLMKDNQTEVQSFNEHTLLVLSFIGWVLMLLPIAATPFSATKMHVLPAYLAVCAAYLLLFFLFRIPAMKKYALTGLYITFSILFAFGIYLSIFHSPNMRATILLGAFVIMPLSFLDNPTRMRLFVLFCLVLQTVLAAAVKPQLALDDTINCLCAAILGCYLGEKIILVQLENFETRRLLVIEKETDVLTGLQNRRKLFETLSELKSGEAQKPSGMLMLDIDHFKDFNDEFGHAEGDACLQGFSEILKTFASNFRLEFYRYGGEEFLALAYQYRKEELASIAESLRIAIQSATIAGQAMTASIGVAFCENEQVRNYEKVIWRADEAMYCAKRSGRNRVCMEDEVPENE